MADFGIKVSRAGFPVETAADHQLLFSSSFPTMLVAMEGTLNSGQSVSHNLGYFPVFTFNLYRAAFNNGNARTFDEGSIAVDTNKLYNNDDQTIRYRIFARDLRSSVGGTNINTTPASPSAINQDYGFKVSQPGYNVLTASLQNLIAFSGQSLAGYPVRLQIIHQIGHQDNIPTGTTARFSHNLGYVPLFMVYYRQSGSLPYTALSTYIQVNSDFSLSITYKATINSSELAVMNNLGYSIDVAYVIFKDPF